MKPTKKGYFRDNYQNVTLKESKDVVVKTAEQKKWSLGKTADYYILLGKKAADLGVQL
jgi:hypothetical protein